MKNRIFSAILATLMTLQIPAAHASGAVAGATEPTQIMNNLQLVASYGEQAQQTITQFNQYQTMLRNLANITPSQLLNQAAQKLFKDQNMMQAFVNLRKIIVAGQSVSYTMSNIDAKFKQMNPGYGVTVDFPGAYRDWSDNTLSAIKNALTLITAHSEDFNNETDMVNDLMTRSQSADGQVQAIKVAHDIGIQTLGQLQKLRQLQMAQMQAQNTFMAAKQSQDDQQNYGLEQFFGSIKANIKNGGK